MRSRDREFASVSIQEVAEYYYLHERESWAFEHYPYSIPPWPYCFIEWQQVAQYIEQLGLSDVLKDLQMGCFVETASYQQIHELLSGTKTIDPNINADARRLLKLGEAGRYFVAVPALSYSGQTGIPRMSILAATDESGLMHEFICATSFEASDDTAVSEAQNLGSTCVNMLGLAFTFANCKNVKCVDRTEEYQPKAKIRRRLNLPEVRRYTLSLGGPARIKTSGDAANPGEVGVKPLHLCRAHFSTYTADKPLFGRHVGKFWIPAHMRGKKENGIVEKDYAIKVTGDA